MAQQKVCQWQQEANLREGAVWKKIGGKFIVTVH